MITDIKKINNLLKSKILFAFDFDGVIADSVEVKTKAFYTLYKTYGDAIARKVVEHHKDNGGMSRYEKFDYYHKFFLGTQINQEVVDQLDSQFSELVVHKVVKSPEIKGVTRFLDKLCFNNKRCIINSATPKEELVEIVSKRRLSKYFSEIYGSPASKIDNLQSALNKYNLEPGDLVFFGDSETDLNAAECLDIQFVGIGRGIYDLLSNSNPNGFYLQDFKEIASK